MGVGSWEFGSCRDAKGLRLFFCLMDLKKGLHRGVKAYVIIHCNKLFFHDSSFFKSLKLYPIVIVIVISRINYEEGN